ncbi:MAG: SNF2-related protein, partial [Planctomycetota bacterium]|nr:SNF2-related protein [Planctomycetota bacterium]
MNTTATTTRTDEVSATIDGDRIRIKTPYRLKDVVKALPGARWDAKSRTWRVPATPAAALAVVKALNEHGPHIDEDIHAMAETCIRAEEIKDAESLPPIPITKTHPWKHQVEAFWFVAELWEGLPIERRCPVLKNAGNAGAGIFHDMGVGKTYTTIALIENFQFQRTLIICPKSVIATWPKEFERHSTSKFNVIPLDTGQVSSRTKQALLQICLAEKRNEPIVIVINYEAVWREKFAELVLSINWDLIVLDEAHKIKSPGGRVSRFCAKVGQNTKHRLALTGSPLPHSPLDAYALYRFLDPGIFGTSFVRFRARYAVMGGYGGHEVLGYQHQDELNQKFYSIAHRV